MIWRHRRTKILYREVMLSFSVERQRHSVVYVSLETGQVFDRDKDMFLQNFEQIEDPQRKLVPHMPHP